MSVFYLLLAANVIPCAEILPDRFPFRNASAIYLLFLSVGLVLYYSHRVSRAGALSVMVKALSWMALLLILLRGIKYSAFSEVGVLARHTWYFYYLPLLLLPLLLFYISLLVSPKENTRITKAWLWPLLVTAFFILLVLTNDLHQRIFRFQAGFVNWDHAYTYGVLFYALIVWQYALYLAAIIFLIGKCRVGCARRHAWVLMIPTVIGTVMNILLLTGQMPRMNGIYIVQFPEAHIFTIAIVLECCIQLGLIPTNNDYGKIFRRLSISAQITDGRGTPVYVSSFAVPLTDKQFSQPDGARIEKHTVLRKMKIPGGFGFWREDMERLDRLSDELAATKEELLKEAELIRLRGELKEKQAKIEQRTQVYDRIAKRTQRQSQRISELARTARSSEDTSVKEGCRGRITLFGAYIKRYANLMLLSQEEGVFLAGELGLSVAEVFRYLNFYGIPGEIICDADCAVRADAALAVFEAFETLLEENLPTLGGAFVNLGEADTEVLFKLTLESFSVPLSKEAEEKVASCGVSCEFEAEEETAWFCFRIPKGGDGL